MVFHWSLCDNKSLQISWTLLSILADLNNAVFWMVYTHPLISKSSSPCTNPLMTAPSAPITNGITIAFMFHRFFSSLARSMNLCFLLLLLLLRRRLLLLLLLLLVIIIIIIHSLELFTSASADGFSLESEWQQVSSSRQDSSQYSGRSQ